MEDKKEDLDLIILGLCLQKKAVIATVASSSKPEYFRLNYRKFASLVLAYYKKYKTIPTWAVLENHLKSKKVSLEMLLSFQKIFDDAMVVAVVESEFQFYYEKFKNAYLRESLKEALISETGVVDKLEQNDPFGAWEQLKKAGFELERAKQSDEVKRGNIKDSADERFSKYLDNQKNPNKAFGLLTGFKPLDDVTHGLKGGEVLVVAGRPGCLAGSTEIQLQNGTRRTIKELVEAKKESKLFSINNENKVNETEIEEFLYSGQQMVYRIKTNSGYEIESTDHHQFKKLFEWVQLSKLRKGDRVALVRRIPEPINVDVITEGEIKTLAYLVTEGCCGTSNTNFTFTNADSEIVTDCDLSFRSQGFELKAVGECCSYRCQPALEVRKFCAKYGILGKYSWQKYLPEQIFNLSNEQVALLLGVMWSCDGSIWDTKVKTLSYGTASEKLTRQIQQLLLRFGIWSTYKFRKNDKHGSFELRIYGKYDQELFIQHIKPYIIGEKQLRLQRYEKELELIEGDSNKDCIPKEIWTYIEKRRKELNKQWRDVLIEHDPKSVYRNIWRLKQTNPTRRRILELAKCLDNDRYLQQLAESDIYWDEICSIEKIGIQDTYDLKMKVSPKVDEPNFIANTFVAHNSGKSICSLVMGKNAYKAGKNILFISIEMPKEQVELRFDASYTGLETDKIELGKLDPDKEAIYRAALNEMKTKDNFFYIIDSARCTPMSVEGELTFLIESANRTFDLIIIDYLGIMKADVPTKSDNEEQARIIEAVRSLGRRFFIPTIVPVQLNRDLTKHRKGTERLSRSDVIGQTADVVIQIDERDEDDSVAKLDTEIVFHVVKNRKGKSGFSFSMFYNPATMTIEDRNLGDLPNDLDTE